MSEGHAHCALKAIVKSEWAGGSTVNEEKTTTNQEDLLLKKGQYFQCLDAYLVIPLKFILGGGESCQ